MTRYFPLLAVFLLFGCSQPEIDPPQPPLQGGEYSPRPPADPQVDKTFMDPSAVEAWRADIAAMIEANAAAPHPRDIWRYTADFRIDRSRPDPILGDASIWDAARVADPGTDFGTTDVPLPRADEALALEANDQEWDAAELWIVLGRLEDAKRCSAELEKEGEWKAVAMIAVHTGDLEALNRATKKMVGADQVSRTQGVARYAFELGKVDVARHISITHGWELSEILSPYQIRELALKGDSSILRELLDREVAAWEKNDFTTGLGRYFGPQVVVADIAILAKTDKGKAREYAARYLKLPSANVLVWTECGEGCYSSAIAGALELYQLIASDKELRELYFARLRQAIDYMFPAVAPQSDERPTTTIAGLESDGYSGWSTDMWGHGTEGTLLTSYLLNVRRLNDRELTAFWVAMLDSFPSRSWEDTLDFEREIGRYALGLSFNQSGNINSSEKFILEELRGGANTQMDDTWAVWDSKDPSREELDEVSYLFQVLTRGAVSASREAAIRAELGLEAVPGQEESLRSELRDLFRRSLGAYYGEHLVLRREFEKAQDALEINVAAQGLRRDRGLPAIELYPDTDAEYDELMAPSRTLLFEKLPAKCSWPRLTFTPVLAELGSPSTEPPAPIASTNPSVPTTNAPSAEPTNCTFVNCSRPKVGEKYVVTCDGGTFIANAEYKGGGVIAFSALTPHAP